VENTPESIIASVVKIEANLFKATALFNELDRGGEAHDDDLVEFHIALAVYGGLNMIVHDILDLGTCDEKLLRFARHLLDICGAYNAICWRMEEFREKIRDDSRWRKEKLKFNTYMDTLITQLRVALRSVGVQKTFEHIDWTLPR
jgi:hypothetical protein